MRLCFTTNNSRDPRAFLRRDRLNLQQKSINADITVDLNGVFTEPVTRDFVTRANRQRQMALINKIRHN